MCGAVGGGGAGTDLMTIAMCVDAYYVRMLMRVQINISLTLYFEVFFLLKKGFSLLCCILLPYAVISIIMRSV